MYSDLSWLIVDLAYCYSPTLNILKLVYFEGERYSYILFRYSHKNILYNLIFFSFQILVGLTSRPSSLKFFNLRNMLAVNCINAVIDLLRDPRDIKPCFMPKFIAFFQHLGKKTIKQAFYDRFQFPVIKGPYIGPRDELP